MDDEKQTLRQLYEGELGGGINAAQARHTVFSSLYSSLSATVPTEIPIGNGVVLKSDLPLIVRIGKKEPIRNVFDLTINTSLDYFSILPQVTGTFPDCRVCAYSLFPAKYLKRWQRTPLDYPNTYKLITVDTSLASPQTVAVDLSAIATENVFLEGSYMAPGASGTSTTLLEILDNQAVKQVLWAQSITPAAVSASFLQSGDLVKIPAVFNIRLTYTATAATTELLHLNFKFR